MANPVITNVDNSELLMRNCVFGDRTVTVGATTTLLRGTVLGVLTATGLMTPMVSDAVTGIDYPRAILAEDVANATGAPVDVPLVRVVLEGEVDSGQLIYSNGTDTLDTAIVSGVLVKDALKTEGIIAQVGQQLAGLDNQ